MHFVDTSPVEVKCNLDTIINKVLKSFTTAAIISTPRTYDDVRNRNLFKNMSESYFLTVLGVEYLKELHKRLMKWEADIDEYMGEFGGRWKYYAASKRIEFLKEYSGDDEDYDPETGEIRTEGLSDNAYEIFTILSEMFNTLSRDIIQDFLPTDVLNILYAVEADASMDLRKAFGVPDLPTYTRDEDGELRRMTFAEQELSLASNKIEADDVSTVIAFVTGAVWYLCNILRERQNEHMYEDNVEFLSDFRNKVEQLRTLEISREFHEEVSSEIERFEMSFNIKS